LRCHAGLDDTFGMPFKHGSIPVIGILGGIGSGKSAIARMFAREGCAVIDSDAVAHEVLQTPEVKGELRAWLGDGIFTPDGRVDRKALGHIVFSDPAARERLNGLIHPRVAERRNTAMSQYLRKAVPAIIWDTPLLMETGLHRECDVLVFVEVPYPTRLERVQTSRGWSDRELGLREKSQIPLDKKAAIADYCIDNSGDEVATISQVRRVLSQLSPKQS
jgi:dephospho-CoA kinase